MNNKTYSSEGFVIGRRKFGEADRILTLFTRDFGKISVIAKGVRKLTSRKRGGIEIFSYMKFSCVKTKSLDILTEVQVINSYEAVRSDLRRISVGYYFCEVIGKITQEEERHTLIFEILKKYLEKLKTSGDLKKLRFEFLDEVLVNLGFWPVGQKMDNPDAILDGITERAMNSFKIGRKMLQKD